MGVGFLSGKEAKMYLGNYFNVALFALVFFVLCFVVRRFCAQNECLTVAQLFRRCFGKFYVHFLALFCCCCTICMSTLLAGADNCLQSLFFSVDFPVYSFVTAAVAALVLKKGIKTLKILNAFSVILILFLLTWLLIEGVNSTVQTVSMEKPVIYALFSVTTSLGVLAPLSNRSTKLNLALSAISSIVFGLLFVVALISSDFSLQMPLLGRSDSKIFNLLASVAVFVSVTCGVTANALPIFQCVADVFNDDVFCCVTLFSLAWTFSLFGFDFALRFCYPIVAVFGVLVVVSTLLHKSFAKKHLATKVGI